ETERLRVHFRTTIADGEYQYANGIRIDTGPATMAVNRPAPTSVASRLPNGLRYGKQFGVEFGLGFEVSKSGKIEKTQALALESFQKTIQQPPGFGQRSAIATMKALVK